MSSELSLPKISLVIPAWNEAACLPRLLDTVDAARSCRRYGSSVSMAACGFVVVPTSTQSEGTTRPCCLARMWTS